MKLALRWLKQDLRRSISNFRYSLLREKRVRNRLRAAAPILVYQMGKVGSSSIQASLESTWPGLVVHTHTMRQRLDETLEAAAMREMVVLKKRPVWIVSLVREPIARNVSAFFENYDAQMVQQSGRSISSTENLIDLFLNEYDHETPLRWFDMHIKGNLGIDVYAHEFPSSGMQIIEHENVRMILMRAEIDDGLKEQAMREFLGTTTFQLKLENVGSQKAYAETYRLFKQKFIPPDWYIEKMYESRYFQHFYPGQKEKLVAQWTQRRAMAAA